MKIYKRLFLQPAVLLIILFCWTPSIASELPEGFVYVKEVIPDIKIELRYYTEK